MYDLSITWHVRINSTELIQTLRDGFYNLLSNKTIDWLQNPLTDINVTGNREVT